MGCGVTRGDKVWGNRYFDIDYFLHFKMAATASQTTRVVLLSCGSFNPITFLHLRMFGNHAISDELNILYLSFILFCFIFLSGSSSCLSMIDWKPILFMLFVFVLFFRNCSRCSSQNGNLYCGTRNIFPGERWIQEKG